MKRCRENKEIEEKKEAKRRLEDREREDRNRSSRAEQNQNFISSNAVNMKMLTDAILKSNQEVTPSEE